MRSSAVIASSVTRALVVDRGLGGLVGGGPQRHGAALAIAGGVDHDALADHGALARNPVGDVLDGVDHLAVAADQQAEIIALEVGPDLFRVFLDVDAGLDAATDEDLLQQLFDARASLADLSVHDLPPASGALLLLARWRRWRAAFPLRPLLAATGSGSRLGRPRISPEMPPPPLPSDLPFGPSRRAAVTTAAARIALAAATAATSGRPRVGLRRR